jgi:hypothetical protein
VPPPSRRAVVYPVCARRLSHAPPLWPAGSPQARGLCPLSGRTLALSGPRSYRLRPLRAACLPLRPPVCPPLCPCGCPFGPARPRCPPRVSSSPGATGTPPGGRSPACARPTCLRECRIWAAFFPGASSAPEIRHRSGASSQEGGPAGRGVGLGQCLTRGRLPSTMAVAGWCRAGGGPAGRGQPGGRSRRVQRRSQVPMPHLTRQWSGRPKRWRVLPAAHCQR